MAVYVQFGIFLLFLWNSAKIIENASSSTTRFKLFKTPMTVTYTQKTAKNICIDHGAGNEKMLCRSIDGKSNRIYAHSICKGAFENLKKKKIKVTEIKVNFRHMYLTEAYELSTKMAECMYGTEKIYVAHAKKSFYYVLSGSQNPIAVMKIEMEVSDYEEIKFEATKDRLKADNIFGFHGVGDFKNVKAVGHVCNPTSKGASTIIGAKHCKIVLEDMKLVPSTEQYSYPRCNTVMKLTRYIPDVCDGCPIEVEKLHHAECSYTVEVKNRYNVVHTLDKKIIITNAKEKEYYYISERVVDPRNKNIKEFSVVRVMHIPDSEISKL